MRLSSLLAQRLAALGIASLLAACAVRQSPQPEASPPVPGRYAEVVPGQDGALSLPGWRSYFTDPGLQTLISAALAHNGDLLAAAARAQELQAVWGMAGADRLPTLAAAVDGQRARVPGDLNLTGRPLTSGQYQAGLGFSNWEIDLWGRLRAQDEAARQGFLAADATRRAVAVSLVAQVANGWLVLRELDERLALARRTAASRAETLRIFRRREELGAASRLELTQVELLWQQAGALVAQLEQSRAAQAHALQALTGAELHPGDGRLADVGALAELPPGLPSDLLRNRPDLEAAEHGLLAARADVDAARTAWFPRITLTASGGTASAALDGLFRSGSAAWSIAPALALPLLDSGRRSANVDAAQARRVQAQERYRQAVRVAFRDVSDALSARRWLDEQIGIARTTLAVQAERARLARLRYDSGAARYLEVLDAERELLTAEQQLVQLRRARLSAQVGLYAALGGGVPEGAPQQASSASASPSSPP